MKLTGARAQIAGEVLKEIERAADVPARRRARLPDAGSRGGDALGRRGAAHPARVAARQRAVGRAVRARRAVDRPAPARQRAADRDAAAAARPRQHRARRRARRRDDRGGRLGRRLRSGRRTQRRARRRRGHAGGRSRRTRASLTGRFLSGASASRCRASAASRRAGSSVTGAREHNLKNVDVRDSARRDGRGHRRVGRGQVVADQRDAVPGARRACCTARAIASARTTSSPASADRQGDRDRSAADRAHAALEPGDLHQGVRS